LEGEIISRLEKKGFILKILKMVVIERLFAKKHYKDLSSKASLPGLAEYIIFGPVAAAGKLSELQILQHLNPKLLEATLL